MLMRALNDHLNPELNGTTTAHCRGTISASPSSCLTGMISSVERVKCVEARRNAEDNEGGKEGRGGEGSRKREAAEGKEKGEGERGGRERECDRRLSSRPSGGSGGAAQEGQGEERCGHQGRSPQQTVLTLASALGHVVGHGGESNSRVEGGLPVST